VKHTAYASKVFDASPAEVWKHFQDFNGLNLINPGVVKSEIEFDVAGKGVGTIRRLTLQDGYVLEKLLEQDNADFLQKYSILETSMPVSNYIACIQLLPVTDSGKTFAQWWADFDVTQGDYDEVAAGISNGVFAATFANVKELLAR
jgi:hypothetical protein